MKRLIDLLWWFIASGHRCDVHGCKLIHVGHYPMDDMVCPECECEKE